jgi:hypothetical protein
MKQLNVCYDISLYWLWKLTRNRKSYQTTTNSAGISSTYCGKYLFMIPQNELLPNKRFSILGSRRQQHQMMGLKPVKSEYRDRCKLRKQHLLLNLLRPQGTAIK